jgi:hypothetical protein
MEVPSMHQSWRYDLADASHRARPSGLTELSNCLWRDRSIPILIGLLWRKFVDRLLTYDERRSDQKIIEQRQGIANSPT